MRNFGRQSNLAAQTAQAQGNKFATNAANRDTINAGVGYINSMQDLKIKSARLQQLQSGLDGIYQRYVGMAENPTATAIDKAVATEGLNSIELLYSGLNIDNVDKFGDIYAKLTDKNSGYADLINKQNIAKMKTDALNHIADVRAQNQLKIEREKAIIKAKGGQYAMEQVLGTESSDPIGSDIDLYSLGSPEE